MPSLFSGFKGSYCDLWCGMKYHKSSRVIYATNFANGILIECAQQEKKPYITKVLTFLVHKLGWMSTVAPVGVGFGYSKACED